MLWFTMLKFEESQWTPKMASKHLAIAGGAAVAVVSVLIWIGSRPSGTDANPLTRESSAVSTATGEPEDRTDASLGMRTAVSEAIVAPTDIAVDSPPRTLVLRDALSAAPIVGDVTVNGEEAAADENGRVPVRLATELSYVDVAARHYMPARLDGNELRRAWRSGSDPIAHLWPEGRLTVHVRDSFGTAIAGVSLRAALSSADPKYVSLTPHMPLFAKAGDREHLEAMRAHAARGNPWEENSGIEIIDAVTDERGSCRMPPLPAGVALEVVASGPIQPAMGRTTLEPGGTDAELVIIAVPGCFVRGRVTRDGLPADQVTVQLQAYDRMQRLSAVTEPIRGEFAIEGVPIGRARLYADIPGALPIELEVVPPGVDVGTLEAVRAVRCSGRLTSDRPLADRQIFQIAATQGEAPVRTRFVEADGTFVSWLMPSEARLSIRNPDLPKGADPIATVTVDAPFENLEIDLDAFLGGAEVFLPLAVSTDEPQLRLEWLEAEQASEAANDILVRAPPRWIGRDRARWDQLVPGLHRLLARLGDSVHSVEFVVEAGGVVTADELVDVTATLAGTATGLTLSGCTLHVESDHDSQRSAPIVDGRYQLTGLIPGPATIRMRDAAGDILVEERLELRAGDNVRDLAAPGLATLTVVLPPGVSSEGAEVRLHRGDVEWAAGHVPLRSAPFDRDGRVVLRKLLPRSYVVLAVADGAPAQRALVELAPGADAIVELVAVRRTMEISFALAGSHVGDATRVVGLISIRGGAIGVTAHSNDGRFDVPCTTGRAVFLLQRRSHQLPKDSTNPFPSLPYTIALGELRGDESRAQIAITGHTLTVRSSGPTARRPPSAWLVDVDGTDFGLYMPHYPLAADHNAEAEVRWRHLPVGARIRLQGVDALGRRTEKLVRMDGDLVLDWAH